MMVTQNPFKSCSSRFLWWASTRPRSLFTNASSYTFADYPAGPCPRLPLIRPKLHTCTESIALELGMEQIIGSPTDTFSSS